MSTLVASLIRDARPASKIKEKGRATSGSALLSLTILFGDSIIP